MTDIVYIQHMCGNGWYVASLVYLMLRPVAAINPCETPAHFTVPVFFAAGPQTWALETLWWRNVQHAQALSQWSKLRCHWIKVASQHFEVSITLILHIKHTRNVHRKNHYLEKFWQQGNCHMWCIVFTKDYSYRRWLAWEICWFSSFSFSHKSNSQSLSVKPRSASEVNQPTVGSIKWKIHFTASIQFGFYLYMPIHITSCRMTHTVTYRASLNHSHQL